MSDKKVDEGKEKSTSTRRKKETVTVKLKVKQLINGKRGFLNAETGEIRMIAGLAFQMGEQKVDKDIWDAAEVYKIVNPNS